VFYSTSTFTYGSTRGLDAYTALEFVRALRLATDYLGLTSLVSVY
jgi:ATP-binding cassette, subfamily G (WHITE), member 2, SNQ2